MEEKKEFLNEENYEKSKKKIANIALIILIVGLLIGGSLITIGIVKTGQAKKHNAEVARMVDENDTSRSAEQIQADIDYIKSQIDEVDKEITDINSEISKMQRELGQIFHDDRGFSDRYNAKSEEIDKKQGEATAKGKERMQLESKLSEYESELWKVNSGYNDAEKEIAKGRNMIYLDKYTPYFVFGGAVIFIFGMISLSIYLFTKRREILAFQAQQIMPVAQEGVSKVAPTIGKAKASIAKEMAPAYGGIAKEITKGIKEGLHGEEENKEEILEETKEDSNEEK